MLAKNIAIAWLGLLLPSALLAQHCNEQFEVMFNGHCYYLDGSGGHCDQGYTPGPQFIIPKIAPSFKGLKYKQTTPDECCIYTSDENMQGENYGVQQCQSVKTFSATDIEFGAMGCQNQHSADDKQLTLCMSKHDFTIDALKAELESVREKSQADASYIWWLTKEREVLMIIVVILGIVIWVGGGKTAASARESLVTPWLTQQNADSTVLSIVA